MWMTLDWGVNIMESLGKPKPKRKQTPSNLGLTIIQNAMDGWMDNGWMDDVQHHNISYNPRKVYCTPEHLVIKEHDFRGMKSKMMHALYGILK